MMLLALLPVIGPDALRAVLWLLGRQGGYAVTGPQPAFCPAAPPIVKSHSCVSDPTSTTQQNEGRNHETN